MAAIFRSLIIVHLTSVSDTPAITMAMTPKTPFVSGQSCVMDASTSSNDSESDSNIDVSFFALSDISDMLRCALLSPAKTFFMF